MTASIALAHLRQLFDADQAPLSSIAPSEELSMIFPDDLPTAASAPAHPDDAELLQRFAPLFERIAAGTIQREQQRELAYEPVAWLRAAGFGALRIPASYGGLGASLPQLFRLIRQLGAADSNLPQIFRAHFGFVEGRLNDDDEASRQYWFPRIVGGELFGAAMAERSEVTGNSVTLSRQDDHWLLNGAKYYCTGTLYADWIAVSAEDAGDHLAVAVPTGAPGVTREDDWDGFGQRLTGSGTTRFEDVRVEEHQLLRRFKVGEGRSDSYITAFYQQVHLATLAGIAQAVLRDAVAFVQGRTRAFGIPGRSEPRQDPLVQRVVGRLGSLAFSTEALVEAVSATLERTWQAHRAGTASRELYGEADIRAYQAQQIVLPQVLEAATLLFEVGGASATDSGRRLDRHWRNARTLASHNPAILREAYLGDYHLNDTLPSEAWSARFAAAKAAQQQAPSTEETPA
ncbi:acyl-CoA dehydrogenase family protein [Pseudomonas citronellolis]|uniref:acyl-CoA dehydrogenase family protein n=1 Tax=Pseudomonas citronellolis TaxID=53408 RepID=UPI0023E3C7AE|nr:acyl-CoA dehydrogenase family protein [Pseudomonas citronellolis]MDF3935898.1 acyl-CoA dehydrogenase family protein [Pseudomonas citronellolis]